MKIISLTMNAFLAYKDKTVIDFESMIDHGIYLISGPTGAGKTTLFDAMTFALYGVASGSHRNQSYFRSDYADVKEETYVEMTFALGQKLYTIKRSPTYSRPGYKTAKMANAYLYYDNQVIEGVKEVNQKINQLLGVDVHQFKQIVMIAQGEFTKLIYASSEEREKVLRHIFHSERLVDFENMLKEKTKTYKDNYLLSHQNMSSRFQLLSLPLDFMETHQQGFHPTYIDEALEENQKVYTQYQITSQQYTEMKKEYDTFSQNFYRQQKINQEIEDYQKLHQQYLDCLSQEKTYIALKHDIDKLKKIEQNQAMIYQYQKTNQELKDLKTTLQKLSQSKNQLEKTYLEVQTDYQNISSLQNQKEKLLLEIETIKQTLEQQKKYQDISYNYDKLYTSYLKLKETYEDSLKNHQKLAKRMERDQENVNQLPNLQLQLQQNEQMVKDINQRRISIHELSELYDSFTQYQDKHFELSQQYKKKDHIYRQTQIHYQQEDENFKRQQAGILAKDLQENQPCPVCGSMTHPHLAKLSTEVLSSKELEELSLELEKYKQIKDDAYQEVLNHNDIMNETKTRISVLKKQLDIDDELSKEVFIRLLSEVIKVTKDQEKTYQKHHEEVLYLKKIKRSLSQDLLIYDKQTQSLEDNLKKIHEVEKTLTSYQAQKEQLLENNTLLSEDLNEQYMNKQKRCQDLDKHIQSIDQKYHQIQQELSIVHEQYQTSLHQEKEITELFSKQIMIYQNFIHDSFQNEDEYILYSKKLKELSFKEKTYQDYIIQKTTLSSRIDTLQETIKDSQWVDLSLEQEKLKDLQNKRENLLKSTNALQHTYQQNQSIIEQLQKDYLNNQDIFERYTMYQDLSDMTSGKNTQRMSFERYVLSSYFEHILEYANIELLKMTNGRFEMRRKQETKGAKQQGLDLSVLDYETGLVRDIQSLSGGESFKAALSLALGLSSMIQSYAGGIELNTLFIDEGFGSLDSESIDQALSALLDMKNDNKVIGIISHVDELKERIDTQIVVEKGRNGSHLYIEKE